MTTPHPSYTARLPEWLTARDVVSGERAIKEAGEKYLQRLEGQSGEEYAAYKNRASFFGAVARTLLEYVDLVFRREPGVKCGSSPGMLAFLRDCDGCCLTFLQYARLVLAEVLAVGRGGTLVSANSRAPKLAFYCAEQILDWRTKEQDGRQVLTDVTLQEDGGTVRTLEFPSAGTLPREAPDRLSTLNPQLSTSFFFHGPSHSRPDPEPLPLASLIAANLDHYRQDADYKHGLHFTALPTAWVCGFDPGSQLRIGASTAWVSEVPGASAGFLEFTGAGLAHLERAMERAERRMALLGARLLETRPPGPGESVPAPSPVCGLGSIVESLNVSLTSVLQAAEKLATGLAASSASVRLNTDVNAAALSGADLTAVVEAWKAGAISRDTMLERLKRGEVLPEGRTPAEERALIHHA